MTSPTASAQTDAEEPVGDIVKLILADHTRIRRLLDALDDPAGQRAPGGARSRPPLAWRKLDTLLGLHLQAEEIFIHPQGEIQALGAVADHEAIRAAASEAGLYPPASPAWWRAVRAVQRLTRDHLAREERGPLAGFASSSTAHVRDELARQWIHFIFVHIRDVKASAVGLAERSPSAIGGHHSRAIFTNGKVAPRVTAQHGHPGSGRGNGRPSAETADRPLRPPG